MGNLAFRLQYLLNRIELNCLQYLFAIINKISDSFPICCATSRLGVGEVAFFTRYSLFFTRCSFTRYSLLFYSLLVSFLLFTRCVFTLYSLPFCSLLVYFAVEQGSVYSFEARNLEILNI